MNVGHNQLRGCRMPCFVGIVLLAAAPASALAGSATRDLPEYYRPAVTFTVTIAIDPPPDAWAVGLEEIPPTGWTVSNISNGGVWDAVHEKIKWGAVLLALPDGGQLRCDASRRCDRRVLLLRAGLL